jgi:hypothetical protein
MSADPIAHPLGRGSIPANSKNDLRTRNSSMTKGNGQQPQPIQGDRGASILGPRGALRKDKPIIAKWPEPENRVPRVGRAGQRTRGNK